MAIVATTVTDKVAELRSKDPQMLAIVATAKFFSDKELNSPMEALECILKQRGKWY